MTTTSSPTVTEIHVTLAAEDFVGDVLGPEIDHGAYNDACNDLVETHVREALQAAYPDAEIVVTKSRFHVGGGSVRVYVEDDDGCDEFSADDAAVVESIIAEIGERVLCGDLEIDPKDFKSGENEDDVEAGE